MIHLSRRPLFNQKPRTGRVNPNHDLANGMIACYLCGENTGTVFPSLVNDPLVRLTNSASGAVTWQAGLFGPASAGFSAGEMRAPSNPNSLLDDLPLGRGFTLLSWIQTPGNVVVFRKTAAGTNNAPGWTFQNNGAGAWIFRLQTSATQCNGTSNAVFPISGPWFQVGWTYNGNGHLTASNHTIYFNGIPAGFSATTNGTGTYNSDAANPFSQVVGVQRDHTILWNRGLSGEEILRLYYEPFCFMMPNQRGLRLMA